MSTTVPDSTIHFSGTQLVQAVGFLGTPQDGGILLTENPNIQYLGDGGDDTTLNYNPLLESFSGQAIVNGERVTRNYQLQDGLVIDLETSRARVGYIYSQPSSGTDATIGHYEAEDLVGVDNVIGSNFQDSIIGNRFRDNKLSGGRGRDTIRGLGGSNILSGNGGSDFVFGGIGQDQLFGNGGNDVLDGGAENDALSGGDGNDTISGGRGNDIIDGIADGVFGLTEVGTEAQVDMFYQSSLDSNGNVIPNTSGDRADFDQYVLATATGNAYYQGHGSADRAEIREFDDNDRLVIAPDIDHVLTRTANGFDIATDVNGSRDLVARVTTVGTFDLPDGFDAVGSEITVNLNTGQSAKFTEDGHAFLFGFTGGSGGDTTDILLSPNPPAI